MLTAVVSIKVNRVPSLIFSIFSIRIYIYLISEKSYFKPNLISKLKEWNSNLQNKETDRNTVNEHSDRT